MFGFRHKLLATLSREYHLRSLRRELRQPLSLDELRALQPSRNELYFHCLYCFEHLVPAELQEHRRYFSSHGRGFGEDAFHGMWYLLLREQRPASALEIGVYRGQTITLWKLLSRVLGWECRIGCISPFNPSGDAVSQYQQRQDYFEDTVANHQHFKLNLPEFCRHYSTAPEARDFIQSRRWDLIYIDGNHDYEVARQDWEHCSQALTPGGLVVLDDSARETEYRPPRFATAGHPGPSRLAREIAAPPFREVFSAGHNRVFQKMAKSG